MKPHIRIRKSTYAWEVTFTWGKLTKKLYAGSFEAAKIIAAEPIARPKPPAPSPLRLVPRQNPVEEWIAANVEPSKNWIH